MEPEPLKSFLGHNKTPLVADGLREHPPTETMEDIWTTPELSLAGLIQNTAHVIRDRNVPPPTGLGGIGRDIDHPILQVQPGPFHLQDLTEPHAGEHCRLDYQSDAM
jgi:hypothetical protein